MTGDTHVEAPFTEMLERLLIGAISERDARYTFNLARFIQSRPEEFTVYTAGLEQKQVEVLRTRLTKGLALFPANTDDLKVVEAARRTTSAL